MEAGDADVLLAGALLRLDEARGAVDADDEVAGDLGVERAAVTGLLGAEDALDPGDHLVGGRVRRLVEVDDAVTEMLGEGALERRVAGGERGVVAGADVEAVVVLEEERPGGGVEGRHKGLRLDEVAISLLLGLGERRRVSGGSGGGVVLRFVLLLLRFGVLRGGGCDGRRRGRHGGGPWGWVGSRVLAAEGKGGSGGVGVAATEKGVLTEGFRV